ncbi:MAG: pantetheine-phosphate adenylyltransferase [Candidatus Bathyarchaeota archaeon]|nr:pantetheine-phosphate adenylyltransferase [Candidatus Bathyarchaeota archaeon]
MERKFRSVAVGGTFDEFHKGHRALIMKALEVGERVLIGLCTDEFARNLWKQHDITAYETRLGELMEFLGEQGVLNRAKIMPLDDPYGVTLSRGCVKAIVVSRETEPVAREINVKRERKGLPPLEVIVIEMVPAENHVPVSTTRILDGEIDREGRLLGK